VQRGSFGACLMAEPQLVADCIKAMRDAVTLPVTVKHRIGIDRLESYDFVRDFVGTVAESGGCEVFIVHARNAWLQGISPKENRELPPLRYEVVARLKRDFPALTLGIWWKRATTTGAICGIIAGWGICLFYLVTSRYFPQAGVTDFGMSSLLNPETGQALVAISKILADPKGVERLQQGELGLGL
jgi:hypothetical protein